LCSSTRLGTHRYSGDDSQSGRGTQANTYSDRTRSQGASSDPGEGSLERLNGRQLPSGAVALRYPIIGNGRLLRVRRAAAASRPLRTGRRKARPGDTHPTCWRHNSSVLLQPRFGEYHSLRELHGAPGQRCPRPGVGKAGSQSECRQRLRASILLLFLMELALNGTCAARRGYPYMPDFAIDPELRVRARSERARPEKVLRRTSEALQFLREITPSRSSRAWQDAAESFEKIRDEWSAIEAVVSLEILLEAEGLLIEKLLPSPPERRHAA
jgi:hypothetical protein